MCLQFRLVMSAPNIKVGNTVVFSISKPIIDQITQYYTVCRDLVTTEVNKNGIKSTVMKKATKEVAQQWCTQVCEIASMMAAPAVAAERAFWEWCGEKARLDNNSKPNAVIDNTVVKGMPVEQIVTKYGGDCNDKRVEYRGTYSIMIRTCDACVKLAALQGKKKK